MLSSVKKLGESFINISSKGSPSGADRRNQIEDGLLQSHLRRGDSAWEQRHWEEGERLEGRTDKNNFLFVCFCTVLPINSSFPVQGCREQAVCLVLLKNSHYKHPLTNPNHNVDAWLAGQVSKRSLCLITNHAGRRDGTLALLEET